MEESAAARKARLKALREEASAVAGEANQQPAAGAAAAAAADEPVLKFRNYAAPKDIQHEKVEAARAAEFEEVVVDVEEVTAALADDPEELLINVAPKKANWDLRRDIAPRLAKLERRTQTAMIKLMQAEEQRRAAEEPQ